MPEITACAKLATGIEAEFNFVPHSGPFARGIHVTVQASLKKSISTAQALEALQPYYKDCPFVRVAEAAPRVKDVATSNYANLSAVTNGNSIAVMSVLDNLNKGAAGGAIQWMNRLLGLPKPPASRPRHPDGPEGKYGSDKSHGGGAFAATWRRCLRNTRSRWRMAKACGCMRATAARFWISTAATRWRAWATAIRAGWPRSSARRGRWRFKPMRCRWCIRERAAARLAKFVGLGFDTVFLDQQRRRGQ